MTNNPAPVPNKRLPWIVAAVAILVATAILAWSLGRAGRSNGPDADLQAINARLQSLESKDAGWGTATGGVSAPTVGNRPTLPGFGPSGSTAGTGNPNRKRLSPEQRRADQMQQRRQLESSFRNDALDPVGGGKVEHALEDVVTLPTMAETGAVPLDMHADCRRHVCKITASFADRAVADDWALFYGTAAAGSIGSYRVVKVPRAGGGSEIQIYAVRK